MVGSKVIEVGDFITLVKGMTILTGQCMGYRVNKDNVAVELWVEGFYLGFELGQTENEWRIEYGEV
jgi:hypothetical protein